MPKQTKSGPRRNIGKHLCPWETQVFWIENQDLAQPPYQEWRKAKTKYVFDCPCGRKAYLVLR